MAIYVEGMKCSICGEKLDGDQDTIGTPHFIHDESNHLWRYSDLVMHKVCFMNWEFRQEFRELFNSLMPSLNVNSNLKHYMSEDGSIDVLFSKSQTY